MDQTDADLSQEIDDEEDEDDGPRLAYEPCSAHNIQLVLKDGFEDRPFLDDLIKRLSKNIVSRSKFSALIAEELRNFGKKFAKRAVTRWNSILFTARSLLKVTPAEYANLKKKMPTKTKKQRKAKSEFDLTSVEREILNELVIILEWFEWVTDEFQSNRVSISKVYPCVNFLRAKLSDETGSFVHTEEFCDSLLKSLEKRFGKLIKNEVKLILKF